MKFRAFFRDRLILILPLIAFVSFIYISGCDDSGVIPEGGGSTDSNVVIYKDLQVTYYLSIPNDSLFIGVNLLSGVVVQQQDASKDMTMIDEPPGTNQNFYFRRGDIVIDAPGKYTRFNRLFADASQQLFDTLSKIDYSGTLDSLDFTQEDTYAGGVWNYFNVPLQEKPIYSFYLNGKFLEGITSNRVYGMFYIKNAEPLSEFGGGSRFTFDVKINLIGADKFVK